MPTLTSATAPYLDVADPAFSITSDEVKQAREQSWYARTPYGLAILRYDEVSRLRKLFFCSGTNVVGQIAPGTCSCTPREFGTAGMRLPGETQYSGAKPVVGSGGAS